MFTYLLFELTVINLLPFQHQSKSVCFRDLWRNQLWQGWGKDVVNQRLEFATGVDLYLVHWD